MKKNAKKKRKELWIYAKTEGMAIMVSRAINIYIYIQVGGKTRKRMGRDSRSTFSKPFEDPGCLTSVKFERGKWSGTDRTVNLQPATHMGAEVKCVSVCWLVGGMGQMKCWHSKGLWTWDIKQTLAEIRALSGKISLTPASYKTWSLALQLESRRSLISQVWFSIAFHKKKNLSRRGAVGIRLREKQTDKRMCVKGGCVQPSSLTVERLVLVFACKQDETKECKRLKHPPAFGVKGRIFILSINS